MGTGVVSSAATTCTQCAAGTYSASSTSACAICGAGQYSAIGAITCTNCDAGKFLIDNSVNKDNHDSSADCQECANVQTYLGSTEGRATCNTCGPGYGMSGSETDTAHIQCEGCQAPSVFNDNSDRSICGNATKCSPGEGYDVVLALPGDSTNTVQDTCANCPVGRYNGETDFSVCGLIGDGNRCDALLNASGKSNTEVVNQLGCSSTTACLGASGEYRAQANNENECRIASIGQQVQENDTPGGLYKASGASHTKDCDDGKFNLNGENACEDVSAGKQGQTDATVGGTHVPAGATHQANCTEGFFNTYGTGACLAVGAGKQGQTSNIVSGAYVSEGAIYAKDCKQGTYNTNGHLECTECPTGSYNDQTGQDSKNDCKVCGAGKYIDVTGSDSETDCIQCIAGTYLQNIGGAFNDDPTFQINADHHSTSNNCEVCTIGKYSETVGATVINDCVECPAGTYLTHDPDDCASPPCANIASEGQYHDQLDDCVVCGKGKYQTETGKTAETDCVECPKGKYLVNDNQPATTNAVEHDEESDCTHCVAGKYQTETGQFSESVCISCSVGRFSDVSAQIELSDCELCAAGNGDPLIPSTGTYQNELGQTSCKPIGKDVYCTHTEGVSDPQHFSENNVRGCSEVATKECVCSEGGTNYAVGMACHAHGHHKCILPCDNAHYLYIPKHYLDSDILSHAHHCLPRGSLPNAANDADMVNLYSHTQTAKSGVSANVGGHRSVTGASLVNFPNTLINVHFNQQRLAFRGQDKISNVLGARAISNIITTALEPGEAALVDNEFSGNPIENIGYGTYTKTWRPNTLIIRPTNKTGKTDAELTCGVDADIDLWPVPDYNYKVFLKDQGDRSLKCWDGELKTLVTLENKDKDGLNTYSAKCFDSEENIWKTATKNCFLQPVLPATLHEGDCFYCTFGTTSGTSSDFQNSAFHRNYIHSDSGSVDDASNCISENEKIQMGDGRYLSVKDIKIGDVLKTGNGKTTTVLKIKSEYIEHRDLYEVECNGMVGHLSEKHAFLCGNRWHHPKSLGRRLSSTVKPHLVYSFRTNNYCSDTIVLESGLQIETWDGRESNVGRPHFYKNGRRLGCLN
jgi:hypothetical protein